MPERPQSESESSVTNRVSQHRSLSGDTSYSERAGTGVVPKRCLLTLLSYPILFRASCVMEDTAPATEIRQQSQNVVATYSASSSPENDFISSRRTLTKVGPAHVFELGVRGERCGLGAGDEGCVVPGEMRMGEATYNATIISTRYDLLLLTKCFRVRVTRGSI